MQVVQGVEGLGGIDRQVRVLLEAVREQGIWNIQRRRKGK